MALNSGTRIGSYEILSAIGAGGMGEVYLARDANLDRDVAIKVLPDSFARDAERLARFQREAKVLASLNHPNIASIYGVEISGESHALIMELAEGPTLADRIAAGPIPIDEALRVARQIADALEYAHERGIVHRDLKPANIKISRDDAVKILDFGLAKAVEGDASSMDMANSPTLTHMATMQGVLLGTAAYMSPEQAKAKPVDRRADIWAFGCVLYEMLTGKMAFSGETVSDTLAAVIRAEPDWTQLPAATPVRVRVLLQRCLQKEPKRRLQAIGEARIAVDEALSGATEAIPSAAPPSLAPLWRRVLPWSVAAALAIVAAFFAWAYMRSGSAPAQAELMRFEIPMPQKVSLIDTGGLAISPDGRELVFSGANSDGTNSLWIRDLGSSDARSLAGTEGTGSYPFFWSADSRYIVWNAGKTLKKIDVATGVVQPLCDLPEIEVGGSWSRDGVIIFGQANGGLMRVSANGGTASPVTTVDSSRGEVHHIFPRFLPDGRHFIYYRGSANGEDSGTYIGSLDVPPGKQNLKRLLATKFGAEYVPSASDANTGQLLFLTNDGTLMAQPFDARRLKLTGEPIPVAQQVGRFRDGGFFSASANGILVYRTGSTGAPTELTWLDRQGKILGRAGEPGDYLFPALSPDGTRAVVYRIGVSALWLFDFSRGTSTRFTFGSGNAVYPIWSPDGSRVIFASYLLSSGIGDLYQKAANGASGEELLLKSSENKRPTDVSRDGRYLLYNSIDSQSGTDIWVLPLQGDKKPFPFLRTQLNEGDAHFSLDGHWIAYTSDESGQSEIYVRPFEPESSPADASGAGAKWQVSYGGGEDPLWSADGKELYYLTPDSKVMEVGVATSPAFQAGTPKLLFQAPGNADDYTIDGKRFLFLAAPAESSQTQEPFKVVLNWQDMLKQQ
jgi:eukaryotic-like serine/threonine-protein kinase